MRTIHLALLVLLVRGDAAMPAADAADAISVEVPERFGRRLAGRFRKWRRRQREGDAAQTVGAVEDSVERLQATGPSSPPLCTDTCKSARNGVCEDGGDLNSPTRAGEMELAVLSSWPSSRLWRAEQLKCDLGTDCTDCRAPRVVGEFAALSQTMVGAKRPGTPAPHEVPAPPSESTVSALVANGVEVNAAWTKTQPPFVMLYTRPSEDVDVSAAMAGHRVVEPLYNLYWHQLSRQCCADGGLVLDVGANFGYYSLYAAAMGCRVVAWEPVPAFRKFIAAAARINNLTHLIHLRAAGECCVCRASRVLRLTLPASCYPWPPSRRKLLTSRSARARPEPWQW